MVENEKKQQQQQHSTIYISDFSDLSDLHLSDLSDVSLVRSLFLDKLSITRYPFYHNHMTESDRGDYTLFFYYYYYLKAE